MCVCVKYMVVDVRTREGGAQNDPPLSLCYPTHTSPYPPTPPYFVVAKLGAVSKLMERHEVLVLRLGAGVWCAQRQEDLVDPEPQQQGCGDVRLDPVS